MLDQFLRAFSILNFPVNLKGGSVTDRSRERSDIYYFSRMASLAISARRPGVKYFARVHL